MEMNLRKAKKITALAALVTFSLNTLTGYSMSVAPVHEAGGMPSLARTESLALDLASVRAIPEQSGSIGEIFSVPAAQATIYHVQDAHTSLEAQQNIKKILEHMTRDSKIHTIFLEGALEEVHGDWMRFFQDEKANAIAAGLLARQGLIGGAELFLLEHDRANKSLRILGVEGRELYLENLEAYRAVLTRKPEAEKFLAGLQSQIVTMGSKIFNKQLGSFFKEWVLQTEALQDPFRHFKTLEKSAQETLGIRWSDPRSQIAWPQFYRLVKLTELEKNADLEKAKKDLALLAQRFAGKTAAESIRKQISQVGEMLNSGKGASESPRKDMEAMEQALRPMGFSFKDYPALSNGLGRIILRSEIDAQSLMRESEMLRDQILGRLAQSAQEKELVRLYQDYLLLKSLLTLELSSEQYAIVLGRSAELNPEKLKTQIAAVGNSSSFSSLSSSSPHLNPMSSPHASGGDLQVNKLFTQALQFYQDAQKRDQVMSQNMLKQMKVLGAHKAILITGGFHAAGLHELWKKTGVSFVELTPHMSEIKKDSGYEHTLLMNGDMKARLTTVNKPSYGQGPRVLNRLPGYGRYSGRMGLHVRESAAAQMSWGFAMRRTQIKNSPRSRRLAATRSEKDTTLTGLLPEQSLPPATAGRPARAEMRQPEDTEALFASGFNMDLDGLFDSPKNFAALRESAASARRNSRRLPADSGVSAYVQKLEDRVTLSEEELIGGTVSNDALDAAFVSYPAGDPRNGASNNQNWHYGDHGTREGPGAGTVTSSTPTATSTPSQTVPAPADVARVAALTVDFSQSPLQLTADQKDTLRLAIEGSHGFGSGSVFASTFTQVQREANGVVYDGIQVFYSLQTSPTAARQNLKATVIFSSGPSMRNGPAHIATIADYALIQESEMLTVPAGWTRAATNSNYAFQRRPDSQGLNNYLYLMDLNNPGNGRGFLVGGGSRVRHAPGIFDVSPDGRVVAVAYYEVGGAVGSLSQVVFYRTADLLAGQQTGRLPIGPASAQSIRFENGDVIAEVNVRGPNYSRDGTDILTLTYTIALDEIVGTSMLAPVPDGWTRAATNPNYAFQVDYQHLSPAASQSTLKLMNLATQTQRVLTTVQSPYAGLGSYDVSPDTVPGGAVVVFRTRDVHGHAHATTIQRIDGSQSITFSQVAGTDVPALPPAEIRFEGNTIQLQSQGPLGSSVFQQNTSVSIQAGGFQTTATSFRVITPGASLVQDTAAHVTIQPTVHLEQPGYFTIYVFKAQSDGSLLYQTKQLITSDSNGEYQLVGAHQVPSGRTLAFAGVDANYGKTSVIVDIDTGDTLRLTGAITAFQPSEDGTQGVFTVIAPIGPSYEEVTSGQTIEKEITVDFVMLQVVSTTYSSVPAGWTRAASNSDFAYRAVVSSNNSDYETLEILNLRTGQEYKNFVSTVTANNFKDVDVAVDGLSASFKIVNAAEELLAAHYYNFDEQKVWTFAKSNPNFIFGDAGEDNPNMRSLSLRNLATGDTQTLASYPVGLFGDNVFRVKDVSPDGNFVVFDDGRGAQIQNIRDPNQELTLGIEYGLRTIEWKNLLAGDPGVVLTNGGSRNYVVNLRTLTVEPFVASTGFSLEQLAALPLNEVIRDGKGHTATKRAAASNPAFTVVSIINPMASVSYIVFDAGSHVVYKAAEPANPVLFLTSPNTNRHTFIANMAAPDVTADGRFVVFGITEYLTNNDYTYGFAESRIQTVDRQSGEYFQIVARREETGIPSPLPRVTGMQLVPGSKVQVTFEGGSARTYDLATRQDMSPAGQTQRSPEGYAVTLTAERTFRIVYPDGHERTNPIAENIHVNSFSLTPEGIRVLSTKLDRPFEYFIYFNLDFNVPLPHQEEPQALPSQEAELPVLDTVYLEPRAVVQSANSLNNFMTLLARKGITNISRAEVESLIEPSRGAVDFMVAKLGSRVAIVVTSAWSASSQVSNVLYKPTQDSEGIRLPTTAQVLPDRTGFTNEGQLVVSQITRTNQFIHNIYGDDGQITAHALRVAVTQIFARVLIAPQSVAQSANSLDGFMAVLARNGITNISRAEVESLIPSGMRAGEFIVRKSGSRVMVAVSSGWTANSQVSHILYKPIRGFAGLRIETAQLIPSKSGFTREGRLVLSQVNGTNLVYLDRGWAATDTAQIKAYATRVLIRSTPSPVNRSATLAAEAPAAPARQTASAAPQQAPPYLAQAIVLSTPGTHTMVPALAQGANPNTVDFITLDEEIRWQAGTNPDGSPRYHAERRIATNPTFFPGRPAVNLFNSTNAPVMTGEPDAEYRFSFHYDVSAPHSYQGASINFVTPDRPFVDLSQLDGDRFSYLISGPHVLKLEVKSTGNQTAAALVEGLTEAERRKVYLPDELVQISNPRVNLAQSRELNFVIEHDRLVAAGAPLTGTVVIVTGGGLLAFPPIQGQVPGALTNLELYQIQPGILAPGNNVISNFRTDTTSVEFDWNLLNQVDVDKRYTGGILVPSVPLLLSNETDHLRFRITTDAPELNISVSDGVQEGLNADGTPKYRGATFRYTVDPAHPDVDITRNQMFEALRDFDGQLTSIAFVADQHSGNSGHARIETLGLIHIPVVQAQVSGPVMNFQDQGVGVALLDPNGVVPSGAVGHFKPDPYTDIVGVQVDFARQPNRTQQFAGFSFYVGPIPGNETFGQRYWDAVAHPIDFEIAGTSQILVAAADNVQTGTLANGNPVYRSVQVLVQGIREADGHVHAHVTAEDLLRANPDFHPENLTFIAGVITPETLGSNTGTITATLQGLIFTPVIEPVFTTSVMRSEMRKNDLATARLNTARIAGLSVSEDLRVDMSLFTALVNALAEEVVRREPVLNLEEYRADMQASIAFVAKLIADKRITNNSRGVAILTTSGDLNPRLNLVLSALPYLAALAKRDQKGRYHESMIFSGDNADAIKAVVLGRESKLAADERAIVSEVVRFARSTDSLGRLVQEEIRMRPEAGIASSLTDSEMQNLPAVASILRAVEDTRDLASIKDPVKRAEAYVVRAMLLVELAEVLKTNAASLRKNPGEAVRLVREFFMSRLPDVVVNVNADGSFKLGVSSVAAQLNVWRLATEAQSQSA